jgi:hypothetical protein
LSPFQDELHDKLGAPVIYPVEAGCRELRSIVEMGLNTSRIGMFSGPNPKQLDNLKSILKLSLPIGWQERRNMALEEIRDNMLPLIVRN